VHGILYVVDMSGRLRLSRLHTETRLGKWIVTAIIAIVASAILIKAPDSFVMLTLQLGRFLQFIEVHVNWYVLSALRWQELQFHDGVIRMFWKEEWAALRMKSPSTQFGTRSRNILVVAACDVSVIIPALNEEKYLLRCLKSLVSQPGKETFEVIVVDGGSEDGTVQVARQYADKVVVQPVRPVGAARNVGVKHARGNILAFIDADTMVCKSWLEQLRRGFYSEPSIVGMTGPTLPYEGTKLDGLVYQIATGYCQRLSFKLGIPHVAGFNCAYRRETFLNTGGFDENRQLSEDVILSLRMRHHGKFLFNSGMIAYTSLRRIRKYGYPYLTTYYMINGFMMLLLKRTLGYPEVR